MILDREAVFKILRLWYNEQRLILCEAHTHFGRFCKIGRLLPLTKDGTVLHSEGSLQREDWSVLIPEKATFQRKRMERELPEIPATSRSTLWARDLRSDQQLIFVELVEPAPPKTRS